MRLVYRQSTQIIQKQRIQIQHNRIKNPNWREATSWLLPSVAEDVNSRTTENNWKSSQWPERDSNQGAVLRARCSDHSACVGVGGGGVHFSEVFPGYASALELVDQYLFPWKGLFLSQGSQGNGKLRRVDFFFFFQVSGGGGVGSKRYVCMYAVAGEPSKEGVCYRAWEWSVWEWTPVLYSKVYFLTKVLHSCSHCKKRNSNTDDNQYLDEYSKPTIIWKCWLDNL